MRKVVDSNYMQSPKLRTDLSESWKNVAVIIDYAAMEAFKGNTLVSICIKGRLQLTSEQERMWPAVEAALHKISYVKDAVAACARLPSSRPRLLSRGPAPNGRVER
jgi:hypothetical protein